jgi:uncharacterized membrane protein
MTFYVPFTNVIYCALLVPIFISPFVTAAIWRDIIGKVQYVFIIWVIYLGIAMTICMIWQSQLCLVNTGTLLQRQMHRQLFALIFVIECLFAISTMILLYLFIQRRDRAD